MKSLGEASSLFKGLSTYLLDTELHRNLWLSHCQPEDNTILSEPLTSFCSVPSLELVVPASCIQSLREKKKKKTAEFKTIISVQL